MTELEKGQQPPGNEVPNDFGKAEYGGPCPPSGKHRYVFVVYALNTEKMEGVTKNNFPAKVGASTIEKAILIGLYQRG